METQVIRLDDSQDVPVIGVAGRFVRQTKLKRSQVFTEDHQLREDQRELDSAPSSLFLLILNNHRLLFCREMAGAPTLQQFLSTSRYCLAQAHKTYIDEELKKLSFSSVNDKASARKLLLFDTPYPSLRITPLLDGGELSIYINRFSIINKLTVKLLRTNREETVTFRKDVTPWLPFRRPEPRVAPGSVPDLLLAC